jgi:hypothetical protein
MTIDKDIRNHAKWQAFEILTSCECISAGLEHPGELPEASGLSRAPAIKNLHELKTRIELVCKVLGLPNSEVERALAHDPESVLDFADRTGQSIDWLVFGDEAMIRGRHNAKLNAERMR